MKFLRIVASWLLLCGPVLAQAQIGPGQVWGNSSAARAPGKSESVSAILDRAVSSAVGSSIVRNSSSWAAAPTSALTLNVDHAAGVDANGCGAVATGAGACATVYFASQQLQAVQKTSATSGTVALHVIQTDCNFTETFPRALEGGMDGAQRWLRIQGSASIPPSACSWTTTGNTVNNFAVVVFSGYKTINAGSGQTWITASKGSVVSITNMQFSTATAGIHVAIENGGVLAIDGNYQVGDSGCAPNCMATHIWNAGGSVIVGGAITVNLPSVLTFTQYYRGIGSGSNVNMRTGASFTFTGLGQGSNSTGAQYNLSDGFPSLPAFTASGVYPGNTSINTNGCVDNQCWVTIIGGTVALSGLSLTNNQNNATNFAITNTSAGTGAIASSSATSSAGTATFGMTGANVAGVLGNRAIIRSNGTTSNGIVFYVDNPAPIDFYPAGVRAGGFNLSGVWDFVTPLAVGSGGTGRATLTNHGVLVGAGTAAITQLGVAANGSLLLGQTGADPAFNAMSGDATIAAGGAIAVTSVTGSSTNDNAAAGKVGEYVAGVSPNQTITSTVTITIASPAVVTWSGNPYTGTGNFTAPIVFTTSGALPTGIVSGTTYWVIGSTISGNTFQVATSVTNALAGTAITTTGTQSGTQTGTAGSSLTSPSASNLAAISLMAGDWDLSGSCAFLPNTTTNVTADFCSWSLSSGVQDLATPGRAATLQYGASGFVTGVATNTANTIQSRLSISGTTTVYLVGTSVFTVSTESASGIVNARRRR